MKILFLANRVPYPPFRGDKLKIYHLAKRLAERHELHLLTFAQSREDFSFESELRKVFRSVHLVALPKWKSALNVAIGVWDQLPFQVHYFRSRAMHEALAGLMQELQFDAVHVQHLRMAQYMADKYDLPRILDLPDAFSLYWQRKQANSRNLVVRSFERWEQRRVFHYERAILGAYPMVLVCSPEDRRYLRDVHAAEHIHVLPNGVDTVQFAPRGHDYSHSHRLLFTGNMDYGPNVDAVIYFTREILPRIRAAVPDVHFVIAGQRPVPKVQALASECVTVTGFIPDLADEYDRAAVVVAPLRFGAGTQNKVLEALSMGIPVVCSDIGFEGLSIRDGEAALMRTDAVSFADAVISLLRSGPLRRQLGEQGAILIREHFSWDKIALMLEQYFREITAS